MPSASSRIMFRVPVPSTGSRCRSIHKTAGSPFRQLIPPQRSFLTRRPSGNVQQKTSRFSSTSSSIPPGKKYGPGFLAIAALLGSAAGYVLSASIMKPSPSTKGSATKYHYASEAEVKAAIDELTKALPDGAVGTNEDDREVHGSSENSYHPSFPHAAVVRPQTTEEVSKIMKIATKYRVPVTAYGGGTSLEGHFSGVGTMIILSVLFRFTICTSPVFIGLNMHRYVRNGQDNPDKRYGVGFNLPVQAWRILIVFQRMTAISFASLACSGKQSTIHWQQKVYRYSFR